MVVTIIHSSNSTN